MNERTVIIAAVFLGTLFVLGLTLYLKNLDDTRWAQFKKRHGVRLRRR